MPNKLLQVDNFQSVADRPRIPDPVVRALPGSRWPVATRQDRRLCDLAVSVGLHVAATLAVTGLLMAITAMMGWHRLDLLQDVQILTRLPFD